MNRNSGREQAYAYRWGLFALCLLALGGLYLFGSLLGAAGDVPGSSPHLSNLKRSIERAEPNLLEAAEAFQEGREYEAILGQIRDERITPFELHADSLTTSILS